ncbi:MAG: hypothetical protein JW963_00185 [Anaerolineales bacterium]|nr:hypothetical protein [Anaerolineales bacterium]
MMKRLWILRLRSVQAFGLLLFGLVACGTVSTQEAESETPKLVPTSASLPDLGPAPELTNEVWVNVDAPLRLANLRGKVVAIDMWTFG